MGAANSNLSAPFYLVLSTANQTYSNTTLEPCAVGSGKTGLCAFGGTVNSSTPSFVFNKISSSAFGSPQGTGFVQYTPADSSTLQLDFRYSPTSNVAFSQLVPPANATYSGLFVAFNGDTLEITDNYDDSGRYMDGAIATYDRWQICTSTFYGGRNKPTLNWQLGRFQPQNPSCQSVEVIKQMV